MVDRAEVQDRHYSVQLQHGGRRTRFPLGSSNKATAADKALEICMDILTIGWDKAPDRHKDPRKKPGQENDETAFIERPAVGDLIRVVSEFVKVRRSTFNSYAKAIRTIYADAMKIPGSEKFDGRKGGVQRWQKQVDQVYLDQLTADRVVRWRNEFLVGEDADPVGKRSRINTSNTIIRNARSDALDRNWRKSHDLVSYREPSPSLS